MKQKERFDEKPKQEHIDITGNKEIYKRPEMVHLLQDCKKGIISLEKDEREW